MEGLLLSYLSVTSILTCSLLAIIAYFLVSWILDKTPKNLPPGPRDWKSMLQIYKASNDCSMHELATKWAAEYGPVVYMSYMGQKRLFLNSPEAARKLFNDDSTKLAVADRLSTESTKLMWYGAKDNIFNKYDAVAKKKRKLFFSLIHLYGDGVEKFDDIVFETMKTMFKELEQHENEDYELFRLLARTLKSVFCILILGEHPDDETADMMEEFDIAFNKLIDSGMDMVLEAFPIMSKIPSQYKTAVDRLKCAKAKAEDHIFYKPKKTHVPGKPRGMLDMLLDLQGQPGNEWMDDESVISFITASFWAAHVTSRSSILASFLCLMNYPKVAKKIQEEVDRVMGDNQPRIEYRNKMPYMEAFLQELLRLLTQVPLSGIRFTRSDVQFEGWTIPKHTMIYINGWYFHHDEKLWDDPWTLKPERFLDENGQILPADNPIRKRVLPFGIGLRSCPGEVFAKSRIFLFITSILQKYDVLPPANEPAEPADLKGNLDVVKGLVRQVQPYKVRVVRRQKGETLTQPEAAKTI